MTDVRTLLIPLRYCRCTQLQEQLKVYPRFNPSELHDNNWNKLLRLNISAGAPIRCTELCNKKVG